jgi:hypothetical protein
MGSSHFHVKGTTYMGMREYVDEQVGSLDTVLEHIDEADIREFFAQVFMPVGWYDAMHILPVSRAIAVAERRPFDESVRRRARLRAETDVNRLYRLLLKAISPETVVDRLSRLSLRYFDFGHASTRMTDKTTCLGELHEIPIALHDWFRPMLSGYLPVVLEMSGARDARVAFEASRELGSRDGVPFGPIKMTITWRR